MVEILRENIDRIREERLVYKVKMKDLANEYRVSYPTMTHFLTTHGIVLNPEPISESDIKEMCSLYKDGLSYEKIAFRFHKDKQAVRTILENSNIEINDKSHAFQQYHINENYFDEIDAPNKAYILGFLYTDGNRNKRKDHYQITLKLQERDVEILERIKKQLDYERPLKFNDCTLAREKGINSQDQYSLIIDNKHMATSLEKWGIVPNKTQGLKFPTYLSDDLIPHFIRGCWDGDGTISSNPKNKKVGFIGTYDMAYGIKSYIEPKINGHFTIYNKYSETMPNLTVISMGGGKQIKRFLDFIYNDADLYLDRKYQLYRKIYCPEECNIAE